MKKTHKSMMGLLLAAALIAAGCGTDEGAEVADQATTEFTVENDTTSETPVAVPPPLQVLPKQGELDTFVAPDLTGLSLDDVLTWAEESGLSNVDVFNSPDQVESSMEFDPTRLLLVVQDGVVVEVSFG